jgi:hypothetical protein
MELILIIPQLGVDNFKYKEGTPKIFKQENGVTREFCDQCGAYICEYGVRLYNYSQLLIVSYFFLSSN